VADSKSAPSAPDENTEGAAPAKASDKVLLTSKLLERFEVLAERGKDGKPKGDDLRVGPDGVEVSRSEADRLIKLAAESGVTLTAKDV